MLWRNHLTHNWVLKPETVEIYHNSDALAGPELLYLY